jgi:mRNA interferase MazF
VKRGEIYVVDLGPGVGREASGVRPVVVVSNDVYLVGPLFVTIVPAVEVSDLSAVLGITVTASESGFAADLSVLAKQPRVLDPSRFPEQPAGIVPDNLMKQIGSKLADALDL